MTADKVEALREEIENHNGEMNIRGCHIKKEGKKGSRSYGVKLIEYFGTDFTAVIPEGVTTIGAKSFANCWAVKEVIIPNTVRIIDEKAFECCIGLKEITIPDSVSYISTDAFKDCGFLETINIGNGHFIADKIVFTDIFPGCTKIKTINIT